MGLSYDIQKELDRHVEPNTHELIEETKDGKCIIKGLYKNETDANIALLAYKAQYPDSIIKVKRI